MQRCTNHKADLSNTKVLVLEREEDPIALQSEDDWVSAKELREEDALGKRLLQCDGPERLYTFMRLWEEFTTKHDLVRPADFQAHTFQQPLICSVGKPCVDCARKRRRTADA